MIEVLIFYWAFAFIFLLGYACRENEKFKIIICLPLLILAGLLFPFLLGVRFYEKRFKL